MTRVKRQSLNFGAVSYFTAPLFKVVDNKAMKNTLVFGSFCRGQKERLSAVINKLKLFYYGFKDQDN